MRRLTLNQRLINVGVCSRAPFLTISMVVTSYMPRAMERQNFQNSTFGSRVSFFIPSDSWMKGHRSYLYIY